MSQQITVLLADDVADLRTLVRIALEADGRFRIVGEAGDGLQAVELAEGFKPDIIVLDVNMPNMDGLEAIPQIHRLSPASRILVLSGFDEVVGQRAVALSADDYMPKSEHIEGLASRLLSVLGTRPKRFGQATT